MLQNVVIIWAFKENAHSPSTTIKSHSSHVSQKQIRYSPSLRRQDIGALLSLEALSPAFGIKDRLAFYVL